MDLLQNPEIREKKNAALLSVGSAVVLLSLKSFLVVRTGSLGVLSEALHSGLDLLAAIITFLSVRMSDQPADERHPYGHGKFESFSAFVETALLIITAFFIIYEGVKRLFFHQVHIQPSVIAVAILFVALIIDITRARALGYVARKYQSEAIEADALHFSTDVWSTMVVIAGVSFGVGRRDVEYAVADVRGCGGWVAGGVRNFVGGLGFGETDAGCAGGCSPGGFAAGNCASGFADGWSVGCGSGASTTRGEPAFCGCDGERGADDEPGTSARAERCD